MKKYLMKVKVEYVVEANSEEEACDNLAQKLIDENMTAESEFWDNMEIDEVKYEKIHSGF